MKQPAILEHLNYIAKRTFKGHALFVGASVLNNDKMTEKILMPIVAYEHLNSCVVFRLNNGDFVLFFNNNKAHHLMLLALKIKEIIGAKWYDKIVTAYDLKTDYALCRNRIYAVVVGSDTNKLHQLSVMHKIPHKPFLWDDLQRAVLHLDNTSLTHLIRKQPIVCIQSDLTETAQYSSWFVDLSDIRRILIPDVDIKQNIFFYNLLREAVDKKVLQKIMEQSDWVGGVNMSVNLFHAPDVQNWLRHHTPAQKQQIVFEFRFEDVVANAAEYHKLRTVLSANGYRFVIRVRQILPLFNIAGMPADYIKIPYEQAIKSDLKQLNPAEVIVTHVCKDEQVNTLQKMNILQMQGPFFGGCCR